MLLNNVHDRFHVHKFVSEPSGHRRRHTERFMDANEIVPDEIERQRVAVIFKFL